MLTQTITYKDLEGNPITEAFWFNLTKAELTRMELVEKDGMQSKIRRIIAEDDREKIISMFEDIVRRSYGIPGEDGKRFVKSPQLFEAFEQTDAYSELFMMLVTDADFSARFIAGILPSELSEEISKMETVELPESDKIDTVASEVVQPKAPKDMTREELLAAYQAKNDARTSTPS